MPVLQSLFLSLVLSGAAWPGTPNPLRQDDDATNTMSLKHIASAQSAHPAALGAGFWVPVVAGAVLLVGGCVGIGVVQSDASALRQGTSTIQTKAQLDGLISRDEALQAAAITATIVGAAGILIGGGVALFSGAPSSSAALVPTKGGAILAVGGVLP